MISLEDINSRNYQKSTKSSVVTKSHGFELFKLTLISTWLFFYEILMWFYKLIVPQKPKDVSGQLVLVTGGANGLGRCLALKFAEKGCRIAIADLLDSKSIVDEISNEYKVECKGYQCNISKTSDINRLKSEIETSQGKVDILVNNAGLLYTAPLMYSSDECIEKCFSVNVVSHFKMVKAFLPEMIKRKRGSIVATASISAKFPMPLATAYSSTKYAVDGFMDALYFELCVKNYDEFIKLTTAYPTFINTRQSIAEVFEGIDYSFPVLTPEHVADEIVKGVLLEKRQVFVTSINPLLNIMRIAPDSVKRLLVKSSKKIDSYVDSRFKDLFEKS